MLIAAAFALIGPPRGGSLAMSRPNERNLSRRASISWSGASPGEIYLRATSYGFSPKFAWVTDRYGLSWRLNLSSESVALQQA